MIGYLKGKILVKQPPLLLLDVGGVGYELEAPMSTFYELPSETEEASLFVHMVVREDAQMLFGFTEQFEKELFRNLLKVNGVGPRVALAILSTLSAREFVQCIRLEDASTLTRVPGIGKKTAERMLIDMRDRIEDYGDVETPLSSTKNLETEINPINDAIGALIALGYKPMEATRAVEAVKEVSEKRDDLIKNALQHLTR